MAIVHEFEYFKPGSVEEVVKLLSDYGNDAAILAGGTDFVVRVKDGFETPKAVVDIKGVEELKRFEFDNGHLFVGALVTFNELIDSDIVKENFPVLWEASKSVASMGIRNRATLIGNICSAVPSLDSGPSLLIYEADVVVRGPSGERKISVLDWFLGPRKTALEKGEMVVGVSLMSLQRKHGGAYVKLGRYDGEDLAQVGVGVLAIEGNEYRVAFCAVGPKPSRAKKIEKLLNGKELSDSLLEEAASIVPDEISPITDIRATREYRIHMSKVMLKRALKAAVGRLNGEGPEYGTRLI